MTSIAYNVNEVDAPDHSSKGRIVTFYSYKGGTGRSMAVANVAWVLALNGQRVLVIDWDLEAPGIHRYFHPFLEDKELLSTEGLLDFVEKLAAARAMPDNTSTPNDNSTVELMDYIQPLEWPNDISWERFGPRARIDLLVAGRQGPAYSRKLNAFNWVDFYERLGGRKLFDAVKQQLRAVYDFVLIDSRTGVSDTSGICTIEMPDTLVVCFTLNDQSIRGAAGVAESIRTQTFNQTTIPAESPYSNSIRKFRIFPVPTRVEVFSELAKRQAALELAQKTFSTFFDHLAVGSLRAC
jgi:MinD-like ATPase involved in chromosome partitioning or flagellar assembly